VRCERDHKGRGGGETMEVGRRGRVPENVKEEGGQQGYREGRYA